MKGPKLILLALVLFSAASLAGCTIGKQRERVYGPTDISRKQVAGITVSLLATPTTVAPGETVRFTASASNSIGERIQIGMQCGPPLDVLITRPDGAKVSALVDRYAGAGVLVGFTCGLTEGHFAQPGATVTNQLEWQAPRERGEYIAVAGLRRIEGLSNLSVPIHVMVR